MLVITIESIKNLKLKLDYRYEGWQTTDEIKWFLKKFTEIFVHKDLEQACEKLQKKKYKSYSKLLGNILAYHTEEDFREM